MTKYSYSGLVEMALPISDCLEPDTIADLKNHLKAGKVVIIRNSVDLTIVKNIRSYLRDIGRSSLPSWHALRDGCPDFHRIQMADPRSHVSGRMHQFNFHPWNQNVFDVFQLFRPHYQIRNLISGLPEDEFMTNLPSDGLIARIAFQFYPSGGGGLNMHADPFDAHQAVVPIVQLAKKGVDYQSGGLVVEDSNGHRVDVDSHLGLGDVVLFSPQMVHGVEPIDSDDESAWLEFRGRWMALISVIKSQDNHAVADARQVAK